MWLVIFFYIIFCSSGLGSVIYPLFQVEVNEEEENLFLEVDGKNSDALALELSSNFFFFF